MPRVPANGGPPNRRPAAPLPLPAGRAAAWIPALDGLRGIAVLAVLAFHGGYDWARGGYLGVSVFFTLSGFLMATILFGAADRSTGPGRVRLGRFWARRLQRLAPAQLAVLLGIVVAVVAGTLTVSKPTFTGDVLAGLAQVANWRFVATGSDYGALFRSPSPVLHLWSLAVEVQLYVVFPVIVLVLARFPTRQTRSIGLLGIIAGLGALTAFVPMSSARLYYGTDVRAVEFCAGALLAALAGIDSERAVPALDRRCDPSPAGGHCSSSRPWPRVCSCSPSPDSGSSDCASTTSTWPPSPS